jgi:hypothetical protein
MREFINKLSIFGDSRDRAINNRNNQGVNPSHLGGVTAELVTVRPAQAQTQAQAQAQIDAQPAEAATMSSPQPLEPNSSQLQRIDSAKTRLGLNDSVDQGRGGKGR